MRKLAISIFLAGAGVFGLASPVRADVISVIIDDIGYSHTQGWMAIALPNEVALSILPEAPYAEHLGRQADIAGHETMLHIPMQASHRAPEEYQTLRINMNEGQLKDKLSQYITQFPYISGINNHMGSQLTASRKHMRWLMELISTRHSHDLFFVDSRTTTATQAQHQAVEHGVPTTRRDVFLDNSTNRADILNQLEQLKKLAKKNGFALGIAHPHRETLNVLQAELPKLQQQGIELIPVSEYIQRQQMESQPWQLSLSH